MSSYFFFFTKYDKQSTYQHVSACSYFLFSLMSSVFAKRDTNPASSASEQLQSKNGDGENRNGVGKFVPERANIYLQEKIIEK